MKKITINNREVELRFTFLAEMIFENIMSKSFEAKNQTEWIYYFFSTYIALTDDRDYEMKDFIKELDEEPSKLIDFIEWYISQQQQLLKLGNDLEDLKKKTVKKSRRKKSDA